MKKLLYFTLLIGGLFISKSSDAQIRVNVNIGAQPLWGPVGYDYVRYYYMPEFDVYYNVDSRKYTYLNGNRWVTKSKLPSRYRHVDLYRTYKVVINDYNPWNHHARNRQHYAHYGHNHHQKIIRDARHNRHADLVSHRGPAKVSKHYKKIEKEHKKNRNAKHDRRR